MNGLINLSKTIRTVGVKYSCITCVHNNQKRAVQRDAISINVFVFFCLAIEPRVSLNIGVCFVGARTLLTH